MSYIDQLIALADAYAAATGLTPSVVSWRVFEDTKKLDALRNGSDIQVRRFERAVHWFSERWPAGAEWPTGVSRPEAVAQ